MADDPIPGRALATRRAVTDVVRAATLGSYGVSGFEGGPVERALAVLEGRQAGLRVTVGNDGLAVELDLRVVAGLPIAEVARQVDSAIRYGVHHAFGRTIDRVAIRIGGLEQPTGAVPAPEPPPTRTGPGTSDLADSGTDVA